MTSEEKKFIKKLKRKGIGISKTEDKLAKELTEKRVPYQRQVKIGIYRVDFFISPSIVIDIKGPHHDEFQQSLWDMKRKSYLESQNLRVYEFSSEEVDKSPKKYAEPMASEYKKLGEQRSI